MKGERTFIVFLFLFLVFTPLISALTWNVDYKEVSVNNSNYWDSLDVPTDITNSEYWYNHTLDTYNNWNTIWSSTYNATYDAKADYQFLNNNFNGTGNFTTTGNISAYKLFSLDWSNVSGITEIDPAWQGNYSIFTGLISNASYLSTYNASYTVNNTAGWILNFTKISSLDYTNVTITESQVSDLAHTTDTNASTECSGNDALLGDTSCGGHNDLTDYVADRHVDWTDGFDHFKTTLSGRFGGDVIVGNSDYTPPATFAVYGTSSEIADAAVYAWSTTATEYPQWIGYRSNNNTVGGRTETVDGQYHLGFWSKGVRSDKDWGNSGNILIVQDGSCTAARCPGRMVVGIYAYDNALHYIHLKADKTIRMVGNITIGTETASTYPLEITTNASNISLYLQAQGSATGWVTHSYKDKSYTENYLDLLSSPDKILDERGRLDINNSFVGEKVFYSVKDKSRPVYINGTICEDEECKEPTLMTEIEYPYTITEEGDVWDIISFNNRLLISELNQKNQMLKDELCLRDITYSWCIK